jgi:hypothetical protein
MAGSTASCETTTPGVKVKTTYAVAGVPTPVNQIVA